ncbi:hypothetical protein L0337_25015 [candidate division KSB1 bacterium]|nr:hypothetical protein [candidate division KSB1 bacterium]
MRNLAYPNGLAAQTLGESASANKAIPFDYVFQFPLQGKPGNKVQDVVEISVEGLFMALSIGYSVAVDELRTAFNFQPVLDQTTFLQNPILVPFPSETINEGQARNLEGVFVSGMPGADIAIVEFSLTTTPPLRILGSGTLGPNGAATIIFEAPLGVGVIRGWDRTNNLFSELIEIGPQAITPQIGPHPQTRKLPAAGDDLVQVYGSPNAATKLFISAGKGQRFVEVKDNINLQEDANSFRRKTGRAEVKLNRKLSPGDVLNVWSKSQIGLAFSVFTVPRPRPSTLTLGAIAAGLERIGADLTNGFRLNPNLDNIVATDLPLDELTERTRSRIFQTGGAAAEKVTFLYTLDVSNSGREYQNKPIHNIAGLGIANGDRPFRPFSRPVAFEPRSFIRIQIEELTGPPGNLFIVLQGYKILGASRMPR